MPGEPKVIFINKNASSLQLSRSEGGEKSRIFSHVQRASHAPAVPQIHSRSTSSASPDPKEIGKKAWSIAKKSTNGKTKKKTTIKTKVTDLSPKTVPPFINPLKITEVDPQWYLSFLLEFYKNSALLKQVFPIQKMQGVSQESTFSFAQQDPVLMSALLCATSGALYAESGNPTHKYSAFYFKGRSISHLKQRLADPHSVTTAVPLIYAISILLWVECIHGSADAIQAHIKGLEQLVGNTGSIWKSPLPILWTVIAVSYLCSAMLRTRPGITPTILCESQISQPTFDTLNNSWKPILGVKTTSFFAPWNRDILGPKLLELVSKQCQVVVFKEFAELGYLEPTNEDIQYIYSTQVFVEHQLICLPFNKSITPAQDAVRIAMFVVTQPIITLIRNSNSFNRSMARQIKDALEKTDLLSLWEPSSDLLLWVLFVCAHISWGQSILSAPAHSSWGENEWKWCVTHIADIVNLLGLRTMEEVEEVLNGFHYFKVYFHPTLVSVWDEVQTRSISPDPDWLNMEDLMTWPIEDP